MQTAFGLLKQKIGVESFKGTKTITIGFKEKKKRQKFRKEKKGDGEKRNSRRTSILQPKLQAAKSATQLPGGMGDGGREGG